MVDLKGLPNIYVCMYMCMYVCDEMNQVSAWHRISTQVHHYYHTALLLQFPSFCRDEILEAKMLFCS